jgi:acyl-CoA synthetase (AMP-forming)/AMP-acid ligase II
MPDAATIPALIADRAQRLGTKAAIVRDDEVLTYDDLEARTREVARQLIGGGVGKRTRVALLMPNRIEWAVTAFAAMRIGAVLVPLSTLLRPPELEAQLSTAAVAVLIAQPDFRGRRYLDELDAHLGDISSLGTTTLRHPRLPNLRTVWSADALPAVEAPDAMVDAFASRVRPADDLAVMFTSGSRGRPKGVIHTHGGALRATASGLDVRCLGEDDRLYIPMPFFWMGGFGSGLLSTLIAGATLLTETDPTPATTIDFLSRQGATLFRGWPDQAARIAADPAFAAADLHTLKGGSLDAVLPPDLRAAPGARANLFGMTESFGPYCGYRLDTDLPADAHESCGRPFDGVEARVRDPESGCVQAAGGQGEIELRGPNLMRGICGRRRDELFDTDGWFATGDLGWIDADGFLFSTGRLDDMFKVSGATVYPAEVEAGLRTIPFVRQAYVTDVSDGSGATAVGALVVLDRDRTVDEVASEARTRLSAFKVPKRWTLATSLDAVPTLATGKVDKSGLQQLIESEGA